MAATIELGGGDYRVRATVREMKWECDDPEMLSIIDSIRPAHGPGGEVTNGDNWLADIVCRALGGVVIEYDLTPQGIPGAIH